MRYGVRSSINCGRLIPRVRRVRSRICVLNLLRAFGAMRRSLPSFEMLKPRNLRSFRRDTAPFSSLNVSRRFAGRTVECEIALKGSPADRVDGKRVFDAASGLVRPAALTAASAMIVAYIRGHTTVLGEDGVSCQPGAAGIASDGDGVVVRVPWFC